MHYSSQAWAVNVLSVKIDANKYDPPKQADCLYFKTKEWFHIQYGLSIRICLR